MTTANPWPGRLKALRTAWGNGVLLTQGKAANRIHVTARSWRAWERGERQPSLTVCLLFTLLEKEVGRKRK